MERPVPWGLVGCSDFRYIQSACFNLIPDQDRAIRQIDVSGASGVSAAFAAADGVFPCLLTCTQSSRL